MRGFWQEGVRCDRETNEQHLRISHHPSGWKVGSCMVERYYGEKEIANEGVHLKR